MAKNIVEIIHCKKKKSKILCILVLKDALRIHSQPKVEFSKNLEYFPMGLKFEKKSTIRKMLKTFYAKNRL